jgi:hypothetical protein
MPKGSGEVEKLRLSIVSGEDTGAHGSEGLTVELSGANADVWAWHFIH